MGKSLRCSAAATGPIRADPRRPARGVGDARTKVLSQVVCFLAGSLFYPSAPGLLLTDHDPVYGVNAGVIGLIADLIVNACVSYARPEVRVGVIAGEAS